MIYRQELYEIYRCLDAKSKMLDGELKQLQKKIPKGSLSLETRHGSPTFVLTTNVDGQSKRRSLSKSPETVNVILREELTRLELDAVSRDKEWLKTCIQNYSVVSTASYINTLRNKWPSLPYDFLESFRETLDTDPWASEEYEHFSLRQSGKQHVTSRGLMVRSKAEVLIAEKLYEHNIPFRYEQALHIGDTILGPDFTIKRSDGKLFYWEHEGLTNSPEYLRHQIWKSQLYAKQNIVPWDNLIVTYDTEQGYANVRIVESEIKNRLLL